MSYVGRLPVEILRKRYAQMHRQLQAAGMERIRLQERIEMLEAENKTLKEERDGRGRASA